jgi:hypothetical protein
VAFKQVIRKTLWAFRRVVVALLRVVQLAWEAMAQEITTEMEL